MRARLVSGDSGILDNVGDVWLRAAKGYPSATENLVLKQTSALEPVSQLS